MSRAWAWLVPRGPFGGAWRGALLAALLLLVDAPRCGPHPRWQSCGRGHLLWDRLDGTPASLLLVGVGAGLALGAALAGPLAPTPGATRAGRSLAVSAVYALGAAGPLLICALHGMGQQWAVSHVQAAAPLSLGKAEAIVVLAASVAGGLFLLLAAWSLRRPTREPLGPLARAAVAASGFAVVLSWPVALWLR